MDTGVPYSLSGSEWIAIPDFCSPRECYDLSSLR